MKKVSVGDLVYELHGVQSAKVIKVKIEHHETRGQYKAFDHYICDIKTPDGIVKKKVNSIFLKDLRKMVKNSEALLNKNRKRLKEAEKL